MPGGFAEINTTTPGGTIDTTVVPLYYGLRGYLLTHLRILILIMADNGPLLQLKGNKT
jgi:hypothetical protein